MPRKPKQTLKPPPQDIREKQDPDYSAGKFEDALRKVTRHVEDPDALGRGKPKT